MFLAFPFLEHGFPFKFTSWSQYGHCKSKHYICILVEKKGKWAPFIWIFSPVPALTVSFWELHKSPPNSCWPITGHLGPMDPLSASKVRKYGFAWIHCNPQQDQRFTRMEGRVNICRPLKPRSHAFSYKRRIQNLHSVTKYEPRVLSLSHLLVRPRLYEACLSMCIHHLLFISFLSVSAHISLFVINSGCCNPRGNL